MASATCDEPHSVTDRGVQGDPSHCPARSVSSVRTCSHLGPAPLGGTMLGDSRHNPSAGWSPTEGVCASTKEPASQAIIPGTSITMGQRCPCDGRVGWHPGSGSLCVPPWEMAGDNWVLGPCHLQGGPGWSWMPGPLVCIRQRQAKQCGHVLSTVRQPESPPHQQACHSQAKAAPGGRAERLPGHSPLTSEPCALAAPR